MALSPALQEAFGKFESAINEKLSELSTKISNESEQVKARFDDLIAQIQAGNVDQDAIVAALEDLKTGTTSKLSETGNQIENIFSE